MTIQHKIRVLIVDDSALIRQMLTEMLSSDDEIDVVGSATDPYMAREKIKRLTPDVITLDVEMPRMDGLTFLKNLMRLRPMPVVMISSLTENGADTTLKALELGAVDYVSKPKSNLVNTFDSYAIEIINKVKMASKANVRSFEMSKPVRKPLAPLSTIQPVVKKGRLNKYLNTDKIIAIGASTGGTEAIKDVLQLLPIDLPGIVITQHIPRAFSEPFAKRMNSVSALTVCQPKDGQVILAGHAYIAPGGEHLYIERDKGVYVCRLSSADPVNRHRPSVDVLFRSVAKVVGKHAVGVMLTGMGGDGAAAMKELQDTGAKNIAQDEHTSVVWGMPGEAVKAGGVDFVLPLGKIAEKIVELV
jgi:two-component system, chemotaxis family, protein-glutamate methylesterase/glutaminase